LAHTDSLTAVATDRSIGPLERAARHRTSHFPSAGAAAYLPASDRHDLEGLLPRGILTELDRYRSIIPDWDRFLGVIQRRDPPTIRVRSGRTSRSELKEALERRGFTLEEVAGLPEHLRVVDGPGSISMTPEHWLGLFYVQQASTGVAGLALDPRPGERVLDLCAAPGGKTTHLADLMDDRGCLVAVDVNDNRLRALLGNVYRTGHSNVLVVSADGRRFPTGALFDRVLVDAPCSAEGTLRKREGHLRERRAAFRAQTSKAQEALLRRAIELTRPGGTILYATCTFDPAENEAIVSRVLPDGLVDVEPLSLDADHAPGVTEFEDLEIDPRLSMAVRIYPHHLDSGGLFMARLRRRGDEVRSDEGWSEVPVAFPDGRMSEAEALSRVAEGIGAVCEDMEIEPGAFGDTEWMARGDHVWVNTCDEWPVLSWDPGRWRVIAVGLRAMSPGPGGRLRATNDLIRNLPPQAIGRRIAPSPADWRAILAGDHVGAGGLERGPCALEMEGRVAGRGLVRNEGLRHEIPKVHAKSLARILDEGSA
jgi:tRNA (cytosine49-C5)-methyltransferase